MEHVALERVEPELGHVALALVSPELVSQGLELALKELVLRAQALKELQLLIHHRHRHHRRWDVPRLWSVFRLLKLLR